MLLFEGGRAVYCADLSEATGPVGVPQNHVGGQSRVSRLRRLGWSQPFWISGAAPCFERDHRPRIAGIP